MPDWSYILEEIKGNSGNYDQIRRNYLKKLHNETKRNIIVYYSGWLQKPDLGERTQINDEDKHGFMNVLHGLKHTEGLDLILHTPGGGAAATESLVDYLRSIYKTDIRAFVPQLAMSGGTVIACACKKVFMGKHSSLGPIDPQMMGGIPAHGVIEEFERAYKEIQQNQSRILVWQPVLNKYQPAFLGQCEKAIEMTNEMVTKWLCTGMFKDEENPESKSEEVVKHLTNYRLLKSHSRHLPPERCKEIGLHIRMLESNQNLQDAVLSVHHACMHTLAGTGAYKIIENHTGKAFIQQVNQQVGQLVVNQQKRNPQRGRQQNRRK